MKQLHIASLYSYVIFTTVFLIIPTDLGCQTKKDSAIIYYNAIWYPKKTNAPIKSALKYFEMSYEDSLKNGDTESALNCLRTLTEGYLKAGEIFRNEEAAVRGLKLLENKKSDSLTKAQKAIFSIQLGRIYRQIRDYDNAINYYNISLELAEGKGDSISALNNLANVYKDQGNNEQAAKSFQLAYNKASQIKDFRDTWRILDNLGFVQSKLGVGGALEKMKKALEMKLEVNDIESISYSYKHLALYYIDKGEKQKALTNLKNAYETAFNTSEKAKILSIKMLLHPDREVREAQMLNDSIKKAEQDRDNKYASQKYNYEKLEKEKAEEKNKMYLAATAGSVALLSTVFVFFYYKQRQKIVRAEERHLVENTLTKKVHDEVGNDIFYLMTQIQTNPESFLERNGLKILDGLNAIYGKARDISKDYTSVNTGPEFKEELLALLNSYSNSVTKIVTNKVASDFWETVAAIKKEQVFRILQELLTNMKKHSEATLVAVTFIKTKRSILMKYADNGKGVSLQTFTSRNGLRNVESRIESIGGTLTFDSSPNKGFKVNVEFSA